MNSSHFMRSKILLLVAIAFHSNSTAQAQSREHPLVPAIQMVKQSMMRMEAIQDYEATFIKRERIGGKLISHRIKLRLRERPFSVYMKFVEPNAGREILYVAGQNQNQILAHEASGISSLIGTVSLPINSPTVMAENRHPITNVGMRNLLKLLLERWEAQVKFAETDVKYYPNARMGNAECEVIETSHPRPRQQFPFKMTRLFIEKKTRLPIHIENYGFPAKPGENPPLLEEYTYTNVRANVSLSDKDFDRKNPDYSF